MKIRWYDLFDTLIDRGLSAGWQRAHKYTDKPDKDEILLAQHSAIMLELCEYIDFTEPEVAEPRGSVD